MSTIYSMPKEQWRAQVRRKGRYVSQCFVRRKDAEEWALKMERRVDRGESVSKNIPDDLSTFAHLIDLHVADMLEVGKALRRSKTYSLDKLKARLGHVRLEVLDRERIIQFARDRRAEGAGPPTISADISYIKTVLLHASAVYGLPVSPDQVDLARVALKRLGLVGKGQERDRRLTQEELVKLVAYFNGNSRQKSPMARLVTFAVATALRQSEICAIEWPDVDERRRPDALDDGEVATIALGSSRGCCVVIDEVRGRRIAQGIPVAAGILNTIDLLSCEGVREALGEERFKECILNAARYARLRFPNDCGRWAELLLGETVARELPGLRAYFRSRSASGNV